MKKVFSVLLVACLCCGMLVGCGSGGLAMNKPYEIKESEFECKITVKGAEETDLLYDFSNEDAANNQIVSLKLDIEAIKCDVSGVLYSLDVWDNIRVIDENGNEIKPFEYALPGDDTSIVTVEQGGMASCTIPYMFPKKARYLEVDVYQDTEYSNKVKVDIK